MLFRSAAVDDALTQAVVGNDLPGGIVPDDDDAARQVVADNGLGQRVVDGGGGSCVGARAGQCEQKKNGNDGCDAH